jgi:predicted RNA-binding Zn-ribbon protein involved in translation (DUF1610 family)
VVTIRDYLRRRFNKVAIMAAPLVVVIFAAYHWLRGPFADVVANLAAVGIVIVHVVLMWRTPCPKCGVALGKRAYVFGEISVAPHCPQCGVDFDEPIPPAS